MPNHVHMLVLPKISPSKFMKSLKGFTAREANLVLNRTGEPFWQAESYDHWVRNSDEGERIRGRHECLRHVGSIIRVKWVCLLHVIFWPGATIMEPYDGSKIIAERFDRRDAGGAGAGGASVLANHRSRNTRPRRGGASSGGDGRTRRPQGRRERHRCGVGRLLHDQRRGTAPVGSRR